MLFGAHTNTMVTGQDIAHIQRTTKKRRKGRKQPKVGMKKKQGVSREDSGATRTAWS